MIDELGAQIEFLSLVEGKLLDRKVASIAVPAKNVMNPNCNRKKWNNSYKLKYQGWNSRNQSVWMKLN